jgi:hypothetical protein
MARSLENKPNIESNNISVSFTKSFFPNLRSLEEK